MIEEKRGRNDNMTEKKSIKETKKVETEVHGEDGRLLKVIFCWEEDKLKVLYIFSYVSTSCANPPLKDIKFSWDRTPLEIKTLDNLSTG
ncbi:hypothetical protein J6590_067167 [Homalodisca vitripennis]|nr:hypothetical protein J6590_067167 [Homalodisca vitripennis]